MDRQLTRRGMFAALVGVLNLAASAAPMPVEHFEGIRLFELKPGATAPRELLGNFVINRRDEKLNFFSSHVKMLELPFQEIVTIRYEYAMRPKDLPLPPKDWPRLTKKSLKHLLTIIGRHYEDIGPQASASGSASAEDPGPSAGVRLVPICMELPKSNFGEILSALELATGRTIQKDHGDVAV